MWEGIHFFFYELISQSININSLCVAQFLSITCFNGASVCVFDLCDERGGSPVKHEDQRKSSDWMIIGEVCVYQVYAYTVYA